MNKLPKDFHDEYRHFSKELTFKGVPIEELSREDLIAAHHYTAVYVQQLRDVMGKKHLRLVKDGEAQP